MAKLNRVSKKSAIGGIFAYKARGGERWGIEYTDPRSGKRRRKANFRTHAEALSFKETTIRQRAGLIAPDASRKSFADAVDEYLAHRKAEGRPLSSYDALKMWWVKAFSGMQLGEINTGIVNARLDALTKEHEWSPATRNNRRAQLSGLFTWALVKQWIFVHPITRSLVPITKVNNARERWLSIDEMTALRKHCPPWLDVIVRFGAATGWRKEEICTVRKSDYVVDRSGRAWLTQGKTKSGEPLRFPLAGWVAELVKEQVDKCEDMNSLIFPGPRGGNPYSAIRDALPLACEKAKIIYGRKFATGVVFHTLRHTMASHALQMGVDERRVMELGNWKDTRMVRRYSHLADSGRRDAAALVADAFNVPIAPLRAVK